MGPPIYFPIHCLWCKKVKPEYAVRSGIVVYGGGDIVFGAKRSNQRTQYTVHSGIVVCGGGDIVLWCKNVKPVDTVCSGHSGIVIYGGRDIVFGQRASVNGKSAT